MVDRDRRIDAVARKNATLAVYELAFRDVEVALLDADAGAVAVGHAHMGEGQALDARRMAAQHQSRLLLAHAAVEHRFARHRRGEGDGARFLYGAVSVAAAGDPDRALALADRVDRVLQRAEAFPALHNGEGAAPGLRPSLGAAQQGEGEESGGEGTGHGHGRPLARRG